MIYKTFKIRGGILTLPCPDKETEEAILKALSEAEKHILTTNK